MTLETEEYIQAVKEDAREAENIKKHGRTSDEIAALLMIKAHEREIKEGNFKKNDDRLNLSSVYSSANQIIKEGIIKKEQRAQIIELKIQREILAEKIQNILFGVTAVFLLSGIILLANTKENEISTQ